ncbi:MAG TPA: hypothetical protein VIG74_04060 [Alphaproteobacteria bacterium]|jgi:hypothetical protein
MISTNAEITTLLNETARDTDIPVKPVALVPSRAMIFGAGDWREPEIRENTNCYAYALNEPRTGNAAPGSLRCVIDSGLDPEFYSPNLFRILLKADGLEAVEDPFAPGQEGQHLLAFAFRAAAHPGGPDFHVWRMDGDGSWSHKEGTDAPKNTDESENPILDPQYCDRGSYGVFAGYWRIPEEAVKIRPRLMLPAIT